MRNLSKVIKASEAAKLLKDGDTVAFSGFGLACVNEEMAIAVEKRFLEEGLRVILQLCMLVRLVIVGKKE